MQSLIVEPTLSTFRGSVSFPPTPETMYYATFFVTNGVGLDTVASVPGLFYTVERPQTQPLRFGRGDQVGVHKDFDNDVRTSTYTLDHAFYNAVTDPVHGVVTLTACPRNASSPCFVADTDEVPGMLLPLLGA